MVVAVVLGISMASAIWVPNVEFIFGLTGGHLSECGPIIKDQCMNESCGHPDVELILGRTGGRTWQVWTVAARLAR